MGPKDLNTVDIEEGTGPQNQKVLGPSLLLSTHLLHRHLKINPCSAVLPRWWVGGGHPETWSVCVIGQPPAGPLGPLSQFSEERVLDGPRDRPPCQGLRGLETAQSRPSLRFSAWGSVFRRLPPHQPFIGRSPSPCSLPTVCRAFFRTTGVEP